MGNYRSKYSETCQTFEEETMSETFTPVEKFEFMDLFEDSNNGLFLNGTYIPEEVLIKILSNIPPSQLLSLSLVCKKWCNIIKSDSLWMDIYNNEFPHQAKRLPWYVYYLYYSTDNFKNILKNGNGQEQFRHWHIVKNFGDEFIVETTPHGSDPLPEGIPDFNGHKSCFATSYYECNKLQEIQLEEKRLLRYVMNRYKPHIYASEWVAGRFDCGCKYTLIFRGHVQKPHTVIYDEYMADNESEEEDDAAFEQRKGVIIEQWQGKEWKKVEILVTDYPMEIMTLVFEHEGVDTQYWKGHYGSKMAGGVVKFIFDSIEPRLDDESQIPL